MKKLIKNIAGALPDNIVFGETYRYAKKIDRLYNESKDKLDFVQSYQKEKLENIYKIAVTAPYYNYLKNVPVEFSNLPFIDKETVLDSFENMLITKSGADYVTTGGTSGKPLGFYINKNRKGFEWYWMTNNWSKVGFKISDYRAVLRNHKLKGKKYTIDPLLKEIQYDNFSLTPDYLDFIIDDINKRGIKYLHAYPSAAYIVANHLFTTSKKTTLTAFLCGSENAFDYQKELIQQKLKIRMYTWYGHSEKLILAGENMKCENFHSNPFYGITEIIDENNRQIKKRGVSGELTGTGFMNTKMPFIRYKTGDFAQYEGEVCPECGHIGTTFSNIKGRWHGDKIYKSDNTVITTTALNLHNDIYNYIKNVQYYQQEKGKLTVRVLPEKNFSEAIKENLYNELILKVGKGLEIEIKEVDQVEYTANNKFQLLIQKIK